MHNVGINLLLNLINTFGKVSLVTHFMKIKFPSSRQSMLPLLQEFDNVSGYLIIFKINNYLKKVQSNMSEITDSFNSSLNES